MAIDHIGGGGLASLHYGLNTSALSYRYNAFYIPLYFQGLDD
jgi:hypothetical protein